VSRPYGSFERLGKRSEWQGMEGSRSSVRHTLIVPFIRLHISFVHSLPQPFLPFIEASQAQSHSSRWGIGV